MDFYLMLALIIGISVLVISAIIITIILVRKKKNNIVSEFPGLLLALGEKENISEITYKGSRVSVIVNDKKKVDKEKIKEEGIETIVVSNKKITMVVGNTSEVIYNYLKQVTEL